MKKQPIPVKGIAISPSELVFNMAEDIKNAQPLTKKEQKETLEILEKLKSPGFVKIF
jgi:hypothetical protein